MVDIKNRVVVGVLQRGVVAILNLVGVAGGCEFAEFIGITLIICRAVAAHGVQHDYAVIRHGLNFLFQTVEQRHIQTPFAATLAFCGQLTHIDVLDAVARTFAAAVVFAPTGVHPGSLQHVHQAFLMFGGIAVVIAAIHAGKHARHGNGGGGAAGRHVRIINHFGAHFFQLGRSIRRAGIQTPVLRACGFTHHQYQQTFALMRRAVALGIQADLLKRAVCIVKVIHRFEACTDKIGGHNLVVDAFIVAEKRSIVLICHRRHCTHHQYRNQQTQRAPAQPLIPACSRADFGITRIQHRRQHTRQQHPADKFHRKPSRSFRRRGLQQVLNHVGIEINILHHHRISRTRAQHQQQRHQHPMHFRPKQKLYRKIQRR